MGKGTGHVKPPMQRELKTARPWKYTWQACVSLNRMGQPGPHREPGHYAAWSIRFREGP